ncbi:MAG: extracellular solute-binding protein [Ruminococcaceae bacterium]|nr:extracellular solute-binding protein [Oscillospiraceae bacterium]
MKKRIFAFILVFCMLLAPLTGCKENEGEWLSEEMWVDVEGDSTDNADNADNTDGKGNDASTGNTGNKTPSGGSQSGNKQNGSSTQTNFNKRPQQQATGENAITTQMTGKDPNANYNVSGKVSVSVNTNRATDYEAVFEAFKAVYKNVDLEIRYFSDSDNSLNYILKQASIDKLPDVVFDDAANVPTYIAQGLAYPLDDFVKNDPDIKYVSKEILDTYRYGNKLFALPNSIHFSCVMINLDIVEKLNLKMPALDWTIDDMVAFLKAGTTKEYSGCEQLFGNYSIAAQLCPVYDRNVGLYGYDHKNGKFNLTPMIKAQQLMTDLRKIEGLEAFSLRMSGLDKYTAKFGNSNTGDSRMALKLGKTLVEFDSGTWEDPNLGNFKFNNCLWPYPQSEKGRMPIHVDNSMMTKTAKNPEAAFQLLRFITYSTEGNLARLGMYDKANAGKYVLSSRMYFPVSNHPDVVAQFNKIDLPEQYKYMYQNVDKCYRADPKKYMVDFTNVINTAVPEWNKVQDGLADATSTNVAMEKKLNDKLAETLNDFNAKLEKHYK